MSALQTTVIEDLDRWEDEGGAITREIIPDVVKTPPCAFTEEQYARLDALYESWFGGEAASPCSPQ